MKKKILFLHAGAEMYGADKVLLDLVSGINEKNIECHVILPENGMLYSAMKMKNISVSILEYPILRRNMFNFWGICKYIFEYFKYSKLLAKYVKNNEIDLVHVNTTAVLEGIYLKLFCNIKLLWHVHEIIVKPKYIYKIISLLLNFSDDIITVSKATEQHLIESKLIKSSKIHVIYNGVSNQIYKPDNETDYLRKEFNLPEQAKVIGMIGRVNSWKGQDDFIKAVEKVLKTEKNTFALIVGGVFSGEEYYLQRMTKLINNSDVSNQFRISDFRSDIANVHAFIDVFVLPSINPDPLPTVVLESMASAKPIVGYNHGGISEMVISEYNGLLSEPLNIDELSVNIGEMISNDKNRMIFGKNSLSRQIEYFSVESYVNNFYNQYKKIFL